MKITGHFRDGVGTDSAFNIPAGLTYHPALNSLLVCDFANSVIRGIDMSDCELACSFGLRV
jgi:hypothetical protein